LLLGFEIMDHEQTSVHSYCWRFDDRGVLRQTAIDRE
jgi:hypothetical protein